MPNEKEKVTSHDTHNKKFERIACFHCGEDCPDNQLRFNDKYFCCSGCQMVFELLNQTGLCTYYELNPHAGINRRQSARTNKFSYLDNPSIESSLIYFRHADQAHVKFLLPRIHCSSCVYLLENLHRIEEGIVRTDIQFLKKEVRIIFDENKISLRRVVETLADIGYEPHISQSSTEKKPHKPDRSLIYKLGVAGFCFGNIMLLSFPEYFSTDAVHQKYLGSIFRYLNVALSIPVFFYCANVFFISAWKGLKHKHLNIDLPVALAILVTFIRSLFEVFTSSGGGYFDSMTGIVFYMLAGRVLQDKTYSSLSFERNHTDYFPLAATVINSDGKENPKPISQIKTGDTLRIHDNELIVADGILVRGAAQIDYSFVTGESMPIEKQMGEIIYAGGKQLGGFMEILTIKEPSQSYLTGLWNKELKVDTERKNYESQSFVHGLARNFTLIVLTIATVAGLYWLQHNPSKIWPSITAVLIIACPCGLLLTSTFTNGYLIRILGKNGLFLRNAHIIEPMGKLNHIVFDKTGTLTSANTVKASFKGERLTIFERICIHSLTIPSIHALSMPIRNYLATDEHFPVKQFKEYPGLGVEGIVKGLSIKIGTPSFIKEDLGEEVLTGTILVLTIDGKIRGYFILQQNLRSGLSEMIGRLTRTISISLLSGDEPYQEDYFRKKMGDKAHILFRQQPQDKLNYLRSLREKGLTVAMTGDGLNDAGALKESDVGICIAEDTNNFTPAADAILEGRQLTQLDKLIQLCADGKRVIKICFGFSLIYNLIGIFFAVQGLLSPLTAAILMPCSTLTIVLLTFLLSNAAARKLGLK